MMPEMTISEVLFSRNSAGFVAGNNVDIVGVTGSIPVTPTIQIKHLAAKYEAPGRFNKPPLALFGVSPYPLIRSRRW